MKISEMLNHIEDNSVILEENSTADPQRIRELTMKRIGQQTVNRKYRRFRMIPLIAAVLAVVLSLSSVTLAASRGITVTELLGSFFGTDLTEAQSELAEQLGTTDFSDTSSEENAAPAFASVTKDGITVAPLAAMTDGYRFIFKMKISMPETTVLTEENCDSYAAYLRLHIDKQVWGISPIEQLFTKEGCQENEVICTLDYDFLGKKVTLPDTIEVCRFEKEDSHAGTETVYFEEDFPVSLKGMETCKAVSFALHGEEVPAVLDNMVTGETVETTAKLTNLSISPLTLTVSGAFSDLPDSGWSGWMQLEAVTVIMKDGSQVEALESGGENDWTDSTAVHHFRLSAPIDPTQVEGIQLNKARITLSSEETAPSKPQVTLR